MKPIDPNPSHADLEHLLNQVDPEEAAALRRVWDLAGSDAPPAVPAPEAVDAALERLRHAQSQDSQSTPRKTHRDRAPSRRSRPRIRRGVWLGLGTLAVALTLLLSWPTTVTLQAPLGEQRLATLPDGSTVELNSGTTVRYTKRILGERRVQLSGEAFFAVTPARQPFVVETFNAEVRVLGTQFNVHARLDQGTTVALEEGRVTFTARDAPANTVTLTPGDTYRITRAATPQPHALPLDDALAWRRGDLVFKAMPVGAMLDEIARRFAVTIDAPASIRQRTLTLALRRPANAEVALRDLVTALGVQYQSTTDGYVLREPLP